MRLVRGAPGAQSGRRSAGRSVESGGVDAIASRAPLRREISVRISAGYEAAPGSADRGGCEGARAALTATARPASTATQPRDAADGRLGGRRRRPGLDRPRDDALPRRRRRHRLRARGPRGGEDPPRHPVLPGGQPGLRDLRRPRRHVGRADRARRRRRVAQRLRRRARIAELLQRGVQQRAHPRLVRAEPVGAEERLERARRLAALQVHAGRGEEHVGAVAVAGLRVPPDLEHQLAAEAPGLGVVGQRLAEVDGTVRVQTGEPRIGLYLVRAGHGIRTYRTFRAARKCRPARLGHLRPAGHDHMARSRRGSDHSLVRRRRSAFEMTDTELTLIAALASMGLSRMPKNG